eukprot:jgi/Bigna1/66642/fgenesh1_pg.2_\
MLVDSYCYEASRALLCPVTLKSRKQENPNSNGVIRFGGERQRNNFVGVISTTIPTCRTTITTTALRCQEISEETLRSRPPNLSCKGLKRVEAYQSGEEEHSYPSRSTLERQLSEERLMWFFEWEISAGVAIVVVLLTVVCDCCLRGRTNEEEAMIKAKRIYEMRVADIERRARKAEKAEKDTHEDDAPLTTDFHTPETEIVNRLVKQTEKEKEEKKTKATKAATADTNKSGEPIQVGRQKIRQLLKKHNNDTMKVLREMVTGHMDVLRSLVTTHTKEETFSKVSILESELQHIVRRVMLKSMAADQKKSGNKSSNNDGSGRTATSTSEDNTQNSSTSSKNNSGIIGLSIRLSYFHAEPYYY